MNSYEIIKRTIEFKKPERLPIDFRSLGPDYTDAVWANLLSPPKDWKPPNLPEGEWIDEWGCHWKKLLKDMGQIIKHPLESWDSFKEYKWPDPDAHGRFDKAEGNISKFKDKYVLAGIGNGLCEMSHFLRGFPNWAQDFYLYPEKLHELIERILNYKIGLLRNYAKFKGIHGIDFPDDWGTQNGPYISVPMFREFYKPYYKRLFETIHSYGWTAWMHSDGRINDLIEEFIDCGLDVLADYCQPRLLGVEEIGRRYRGRLCFEVSVDIQATLPTGDKELIYKEAKLLFESLSTLDGGFIAEDYHTPSAIGVSTDTMKYMLEAFQELWRKRYEGTC